jgi:hypothetical protein
MRLGLAIPYHYLITSFTVTLSSSSFFFPLGSYKKFMLFTVIVVVFLSFDVLN